MLLDARADPNITPNNFHVLEKKTCLHQLALEWDLPVTGPICTILLMRGGAKLNVKDKNRCTPLDIAELFNNTYVIDAINTFNERIFSVAAMNHRRLAEGPSRALNDDVIRKIWNLS